MSLDIEVRDSLGIAIDGFRAGSYTGYAKWRSILSKLTNESAPFYELINFSDCEGILDTKTCKKLSVDFKTFNKQAEAVDDEWFYTKYVLWKNALLKVAANDGDLLFY